LGTALPQIEAAQLLIVRAAWDVIRVDVGTWVIVGAALIADVPPDNEPVQV